MATIQVWAPALSPLASSPSAAADAPAAAPALPSAAAAAPSAAIAPRATFAAVRPYDVESSVLSRNLKTTLADFQKVMDDLPKSPAGYVVDEIELNLGFTSKGGIAFFTKLELGVDAAVKVKIKRETPH